MVELIITIGILGVLSAFAAPTMIKTMNKTRFNSEVQAVLETLQQARTEAVLRKAGHHISISESADPRRAGKKNAALTVRRTNRNAMTNPTVLEHTTLTITTPKSVNSIDYDFMGRVISVNSTTRIQDVSGQCINLLIRSKDDASIVASIEVREVGRPEILKLEQSQCRNN